MDQPGDPVAQIARSLHTCLVQAGHLRAMDRFERLSGGRTNLVWQVDTLAGPLICKLALAGRDTPLFPNLPKAEEAALRALADLGLAPRLIAALDTPMGPCLLYHACPGTPWRRDAGPVGAVLARLHRAPVLGKLRLVATAADEILAQGDAMLRQTSGAADLAALRPALPNVRPGKIVLLHGDPVPGNIIVAGGKPVLIDWQCPGLGDPVHDLGLFLSPAMQTLGRGAPLSADERAAFLSGHGDRAAAGRLATLEPALSWRMAVYCAWRIARGHEDYQPALAAELDHLEKLR